MINWKIRRVTPTGSIIDIYDTENGTAAGVSAISFNLSASGNCLEAEILANPSMVPFNPRDTVMIWIKPEGGVYTAFYWGVLIKVPDSRGENLAAYRAVGFYKRFQELLVEDAVINGDDVATMAYSGISGGILPTGVSAAVGDFPATNFDLGDRFPGFETKADFLNALAQSVGSFIVPTGETYTYDGVTYNAGEAVPPVEWGVDAGGDVFFRRTQASLVALDEDSEDVWVVWKARSGEEIYDRVTLIYGGGGEAEGAARFAIDPTASASPSPVEAPVIRPIARSFGSGDYESERRIVVKNALDYMAPPSASPTTHQSVDMTNVSNLTDDNDGTYASPSAGTTGVLTLSWPVLDGLVRYKFRKGNDNAIDYLVLTWYDTSTGYPNGVLQTVRYDFGDIKDTNDHLIYVPASLHPTINEANAETTLYVTIVLEDGGRAYELTVNIPDTDAASSAASPGSELLAETYYQDPSDAAARVEYRGVGDVTNSLELTLEDNSVLDLAVKRVEYRISPQEGVLTIYHVGEPFDVDMQSERVLIEQIAKKVQQ